MKEKIFRFPTLLENCRDWQSSDEMREAAVRINEGIRSGKKDAFCNWWAELLLALKRDRARPEEESRKISSKVLDVLVDSIGKTNGDDIAMRELVRQAFLSFEPSFRSKIIAPSIGEDFWSVNAIVQTLEGLVRSEEDEENLETRELELFSAWRVASTQVAPTLRDLWRKEVSGWCDSVDKAIDETVLIGECVDWDQAEFLILCMTFDIYLYGRDDKKAEPNQTEPSWFRLHDELRFDTGENIENSIANALSKLDFSRDSKKLADFLVLAGSRRPLIKTALHRCFGFEFSDRKKPESLPPLATRAINREIVLAGTRRVGKTSLLYTLSEKLRPAAKMQPWVFQCQRWNGNQKSWIPIVSETVGGVDENLTHWRNREAITATMPEADDQRANAFRGCYIGDRRNDSFNFFVKDVAGETFAPRNASPTAGSLRQMQRYLENSWLQGMVLILDPTDNHQQQILGIQTIINVLKNARRGLKDSNATWAKVGLEFPLQICINKADLVFGDEPKSDARVSLLGEDEWTLRLSEFFESSEIKAIKDDNAFLSELKRRLRLDYGFGREPGIVQAYMAILQEFLDAAANYNADDNDFAAGKTFVGLFSLCSTVSFRFTSCMNDPPGDERSYFSSASNAWKGVVADSVEQTAQTVEQNFRERFVNHASQVMDSLGQLRDLGQTLQELAPGESSIGQEFQNILADQPRYDRVAKNLKKIQESWKIDAVSSANWEDDGCLIGILLQMFGVPVSGNPQPSQDEYTGGRFSQCGFLDRDTYTDRRNWTINQQKGANFHFCAFNDLEPASRESKSKALLAEATSKGNILRYVRAALLQQEGDSLEKVKEILNLLYNYKLPMLKYMRMEPAYDFCQFELLNEAEKKPTDKRGTVDLSPLIPSDGVISASPYMSIQASIENFAKSCEALHELASKVRNAGENDLGATLQDWIKYWKGPSSLGWLLSVPFVGSWLYKIVRSLLNKKYEKGYKKRKSGEGDVGLPGKIDNCHLQWTVLGRHLVELANSMAKGFLYSQLSYLSLQGWDHLKGDDENAIVHSEKVTATAREVAMSPDPFQVYEKGAGGAMSPPYQELVQNYLG